MTPAPALALALPLPLPLSGRSGARAARALVCRSLPVGKGAKVAPFLAVPHTHAGRERGFGDERIAAFADEVHLFLGGRGGGERCGERGSGRGKVGREERGEGEEGRVKAGRQAGEAGEEERGGARWVRLVC